MTTTFKISVSLPVREIPNKVGMCLAVHEKAFKEIIQERLNHCQQALFANIIENEAFLPFEHADIVCYKRGGHFSRPVFERLQKALNEDMYQWEMLVWQQIIRQLFIMQGNNELFNIATEILLMRQTPDKNGFYRSL